MLRYLALALLLTACGKDEGGSVPEGSQMPQQGAQLVNSQADLPHCEQARGGLLVYVKQEGKFYTCDGNAWSEVSIKGDKGDTGATGTTGAQGEKGEEGSNDVKYTMYCSGTGTNNAGVNFSSYTMMYWATQMESGDVWVAFTISNGVLGTSGTRFYSKAQNGSLTGSVEIVYDSYNSNNGGFWLAELDRVTKLMTVKYTDSEMPGTSTRSWVFPTSNCTLQEY